MFKKSITNSIFRQGKYKLTTYSKNYILTTTKRGTRKCQL